MAAVEKLQRRLHKITIGVLKVIPILLAFISLLNCTLSYFGIDLILLSYIGCTSLLPLVFLYLSSYCFGFCSYHRMFLHYVVVSDIIAAVDYNIGLPISDRGLFSLNIIIAGITLYIVLYLHQHDRNNKRTVAKNHR